MIDINPGQNEEIAKEMFAFVSIDSGGEGVCAFCSPTGQWMPMVGTTRRTAHLMKSMAREMSAMPGGKKIVLKWFKLESTEEID